MRKPPCWWLERNATRTTPSSTSTRNPELPTLWPHLGPPQNHVPNGSRDAPEAAANLRKRRYLAGSSHAGNAASTVLRNHRLPIKEMMTTWTTNSNRAVLQNQTPRNPPLLRSERPGGLLRPASSSHSPLPWRNSTWRSSNATGNSRRKSWKFLRRWRVKRGLAIRFAHLRYFSFILLWCSPETNEFELTEMVA